MKILDLYIIKKFLKTFFFFLFLFSVIAAVIDLTEKVDELIENSVPVKSVIFDYYFNFIPYIDSLLTPLFIFISVIFFTSRMASNSEFIAMLGSGISFYRLLVPYLVAATILAAMLLYANHNLVPNANRDRMAFEFTYISNPNKRVNRNTYMQIERDKYIYMENYSPKDSTGFKFSYEIIKDGKLEYKLLADRIEWQNEQQKWRLKNYYVREFDRINEKVSRGNSLDTLLNFTPKDFVNRISLKEEMNTTELKAHIEKLRLRGAEDIAFYLIELYRRTADAFTIFILTIIGVSIGSRKIRGGLGLHIVMGFLISSLYIISMRFSTTFSTNGDLSPFLSIWIPNLVFGILAIWLVIKTPK